MISFKKAGYVALTGVVALTLAGTTLSSASAAELPSGSAQPVYILDAGDGTRMPSVPTPWDYAVVAGPQFTGSLGDPTVAADFFKGSPDATSVEVFITKRGTERDLNNWIMHSGSGFYVGTTDAWLPTLTPDSMIAGAPASVKGPGGEFSLGIAFVRNNGLTLADAGVSFAHITVAPGTGDYTFDVVDAEPTTPTDPTLNGEIGLEATTIAAEVVPDGPLSLSVPAGAKATLGAAALENGLSTSKGKLGQFSVVDDRRAAMKGWTLTASVADFTSGTSVIDKKQLGIKPFIVAGSPVDVKAGAEQVAGAAAGTATFASLDAAKPVGTTVLDADLTFVAPKDAAVGTYTSKLTVTLASK